MRRTGLMIKALALLVLVSLLIIQPGRSAAQVRENRPIPLGISGGNILDFTNSFCCGGTLGALVQDKKQIQYILSNNHVLARTNRGVAGEAIIQPGLNDTGCSENPGDTVATLSRFVRISYGRNALNRVDAAIAKVQNGRVDPFGSILNIGEPSNATVAPLLGMPVKKNGRTSGLTFGTITAVDVTIDVTYERQCGTGTQRARFRGQMMVGPEGFGTGGDSGSLIVEDCSPYPRAVGLLFGGANNLILANPIGVVLSKLRVRMVGRGEFCSSSGSALPGNLPMRHFVRPDRERVEKGRKIKERYEEMMFKIEDVVGTGVGISDTTPGQVVIETYVRKSAHRMKSMLPEVLEDIPIKIVETGDFIAY